MARSDRGKGQGAGGPGLVERLKGGVEIPLWGVAALAVLVVVLALFLWSAKNRRQSHVRPEVLASFTQLLPSIAGLTGSPLIEGNAVTVLQDSALFDALLADVNTREHRKLAIVDGRVGYTFGHGVAREWTAAGKGWRDTAIRVEGPLVASLQSVFLENWMEETGEVPTGVAYFPELEPVGDVRGHVVASSHHGQVSTVELLHKLAIASAREEILIQNPYFLPDEDVLNLIEGAARRGVEVSIMLPGPEATDSDLIFHASHIHYRRLLEAGVRLYEYRPTLLHQKVLVVDGVWSHVGSTNFDSRSFEINDEVSVGLIDRGVAARLTEAFQADRRQCRQIPRGRWRRSMGHRLLDRLAHLAHEQL